MRILRAFRFADRLGFRLDGLTFLGMNKHCDRLSIISQERITDEFNKILLGNDPTYMFGGLLGPTLKKYIFPVLDEDGLSKIFNISLKQNLKRCPKDLIVRLAVLFNRLETTTIKILMRSMKYSNDQIDEVCFLVEKGNKYKDYTFIKPTVRQIMFECKTFSRFCCLTSFLEAIEEKGYEYFEICAPILEGTQDLINAIAKKLATLPPIKIYEREEITVSDIYKTSNRDFKIRVEDDVYIIEAEWLAKILSKTDLEDYESLQYFQNALQSSGIINALIERGIQEGDTVSIYDLEFDYVP